VSLTDLIPGVSEAKLIGAGVALAGVVGLVAWGGIQTARLHHAKNDVTTARAALIDPVTKKTWQSEEQAAQRDLGTCTANSGRLDAALAAANDSIQALKDAAVADAMANRAHQTAAQARSADARRDVAALMETKPSGDRCGSAFELMREP